MKSILIIYEQALQPEIREMMRVHNVQGFTRFRGVSGKGSRGGQPHLGSHAWPALNDIMLLMVEDDKMQPILDTVKEIDDKSEILGIRAFVWNIEAMVWKKATGFLKKSYQHFTERRRVFHKTFMSYGQK